MTLRLSMIPIVLSLFAMVLTIPLVVLKATQEGPVANFKTQAARDNEISASFFPTRGDYLVRAGLEIPVAVIVESPVLKVGPLDLVISYDSQLVEAKGLAEGIIFDSYTQLRIDPNGGKIYISAKNSQPRPVTGIVASFKLMPKTEGVANLNFVQASGTNNTINASYLLK